MAHNILKDSVEAQTNRASIKILGILLGGLLVGLLESLGAGYISSGYKDAIAFLILFIILLVKPNGILGKRKAERA